MWNISISIESGQNLRRNIYPPWNFDQNLLSQQPFPVMSFKHTHYDHSKLCAPSLD